MNLRVKILDGRDISLTPSPSTSLEQFKELIFQQTGIPANRQRLIYQGRPLTNNSGALETLGIQDGHVIHLVERPEHFLFMSYTTQNAEPEQSEQHQENNWHFGVPNNSRSVGVEPDDPIGQVGLNENVVSYSIPVVFGRSASALQTFRMIVERSIRDIFPDIAQQIQVQTRLREPGNPIIGSIVVHLPGQENPVVDSPAIERVNMIQEHLSHIEAFLSVTAEGFSDLVDSILNGAAKLDPESEREQRKTLVNWVEKMQCVGEQNVEKNCNWVANGESSNENGRMQQLGTSQNETGIRRQNETQGFEGQPQYQIRHGLATDLLPMIESLVQLNTLLAPHLIRMSRVVRHNDNFDIGTQETLLTDSRANCLTVYLEQLQKTIHRHSHVLHLVSDLNIHFDDPTPRRLFPQYSRYRAEPSAEGELVFDVYLESDENSTNTSQTSAFNALTVPYEGRPDRPFLSSIASPFGTGPYREGMMVPIGMGIQISAQPPVAHQNPSGSSGSQNSNTSIPPQAAQPPPGITINRTGNPGGGLSSLISSVIQNAMTRNIPRTTMINVAGPLSSQPTQQVPLMVPTPNHQHLHNHNLHHFSAHHIGHHPMMSLGAPNRQNGNNSAQQQQTRNSTPLQPPVAPLHNQQNVIDFPREAQLQGGSNEGADPFLACSSRHINRSYQHYERIMSLLDELPSTPTQPLTQLGRMASEIQIRRTGRSQIWAMNDSELAEMTNFSLRTIRGLMEEADRERNGPFGAAMAQVVTIERHVPTHAHIAITAEMTPASPIDVDPPNDHDERERPDIDFNSLPENSRHVLQSLFTSTTNRSNEPVGRILSRLNPDENPNTNNLIGILNFLIGECLGMVDLISLMGGRLDSIGRHRNAFRRLIIEHFLFDNSRPSLNDITSAAARMAVDSTTIRDLVQNGGGEITVNAFESTWDVPETAVRIERIAIERLLQTLFNQELTDNIFATTAQSIITQYLHRMMILGNMATGGRPYGYERLIQQYLVRDGAAFLGDQNTSTIHFVRDACLQHLRRLAAGDNGGTSIEDLKDVLVAHLAGSAPKKMRHDCGVENQDSSRGTSFSAARVNERDIETRSESWQGNVPVSWVSTLNADVTRIAQSSRTTFRSPAFQQIFGRNASYQSARSVTDEAFLSALEMVTHTVGAPQSPMHLTLDGNDYQQLQEIILNNATQDLEIAENDSERFPTLSQIQEQGGSKI